MSCGEQRHLEENTRNARFISHLINSTVVGHHSCRVSERAKALLGQIGRDRKASEVLGNYYQLFFCVTHRGTNRLKRKMEDTIGRFWLADNLDQSIIRLTH